MKGPITSSVTQPKSMAKVLRQTFANHDVNITYSACLDVVARQYGYADWNTLQARQMKTRRLTFKLFIEHGREDDACAFYKAAFDAAPVRTYDFGVVLAGAELLIANCVVTVCGANLNRERQPERGGPFYLKAPGSVSTTFQIETSDIEASVKQAATAGARIRDRIQRTTTGSRAASVFDPLGHIWVLQQT